MLTLTCVDTWFDNVPLHKYLDADVFTDMQEDWQDEIGSIVFGENVVIDAPVYDITTNSIHLFAGFEFSSHEMSAVDAVYDKNTLMDLDASAWLEIDLSPSEPLAGPIIGGLYSGDGWYALSSGPRGLLISATSPVKIASISNRIQDTGTPTSAEGTFQIKLYRAVQLSDSNSWEPTGTAIATVSIDPASITSANNRTQIMAPHPTLPTGHYMLVPEWSNRDDASNYLSISYENSTGWVFWKDWSEHDKGWARITSKVLGLSISAFEGYALAHTSSGSTYWARQTLGDTASIGSGLSEIDSNQQLKAKTDGLKDNSSGTYTGSASALIKNPSDVIHFTLLHSEMVGHPSAGINSSAFSSVRSSLSSAGFDLAFAINTETYATDLIYDICEQCRIQFYRQRDGDFALRYPTYSSTVAHTFNQTAMQGQLSLLGVYDNDESSVINSFSYLHTPNPLQNPVDAAFLRRAKSDKYSGHVYLNADDSSDSDTTREGNMSDSVDLYGMRPHSRTIVDKLDSAAAVEKLRDYNADRYSTLQRRFEITVPRSRWYNEADMFDILEVEHADLPDSGGTYSDDAADSQSYTNGIPTASASLGSMWGECVEVRESGEWMTFVVETVSSY
jgi:hypothetical protein